MSVLKRAKTWEISESEDDNDDAQLMIKDVSTDLENEETNHTPDCKPISNSHSAQSSSSLNLVPPPPPTVCGTPSTGKTRRTKEEIEANRLRVQERKEDREKQRLAKAKEKEEKRQEQERRREAAEHLKRHRPENYLKSLTVCIDPGLLQDDGSDILLGTLSAFEWRFSIETQQIPRSIMWTRDLSQSEDSCGALEEEHVLLVLRLSDFMDMVVCVKETLQRDGEESKESFFKHVLGCLNLDAKKVLVHLQLHRNITVVFLSGWQQVTDHVCAITKALSKRPFKQLTERSDLPFCVDGSWASGVRVERHGSGLDQVWTRQIQQLNRVSPTVASAVTAAYPSPQLLLQAYQRLESEEEKRGLLAGLLVKSGGKERRIGPDISARIYRVFTTINPQLVLD
ncbi:essential meiotic structure-specific endonuclease subunit 2 [Aplochiton taeniatus]